MKKIHILSFFHLIGGPNTLILTYTNVRYRFIFLLSYWWVVSIFAVACRKRGAKQLGAFRGSTNLTVPVKLRFLGLLLSPDHPFADELFRSLSSLWLFGMKNNNKKRDTQKAPVIVMAADELEGYVSCVVRFLVLLAQDVPLASSFRDF